MTDHHLINIILPGITPRICQAMAHYEDLRSDPSKWKEKLLYMDFITTEFEKKEPHNRNKGQGKKHSIDQRIQVRGGEAGSERKKGEFVHKEVWNKRKQEGRCIKCGRSNHQARDCEALLRAKTRPCYGNANREPVQKKWKFNRGHLKITELSSDEDVGNQ